MDESLTVDTHSESQVIFIKVLSVLCPNLTDASLNLWSITVSTLGPQQREERKPKNDKKVNPGIACLSELLFGLFDPHPRLISQKQISY